MRVVDRLIRIVKKNIYVFIFFQMLYYPIKQIKTMKLKKEIENESISLLGSVQKNNRNKPIIFYIGVPLHKNLGDLTQMFCILNYLNNNFSDYQVISLKSYAAYSKNIIKLIKNNILPKDIFVFQSGYCTTDIHLDHTMHKIIVKNFPNNRIVFMPQTVLFKDVFEARRTSAIFNRHRRMLFISRDYISKSYADELFPDVRRKCLPDIVSTLIGKYTMQLHRHGILMCLRNDSEKKYTDRSLNSLKEKLSGISDLINVTDTTVDGDYEYIINNIQKVINEKIVEFSKYDVVITDRFHGVIFSLIANVPVIVLASSDHKVVAGLKWFEEIYSDMCFYTEGTDAVITLVHAVLNRKESVKRIEGFSDKLYDPLRKWVEEM